MKRSLSSLYFRWSSPPLHSSARCITSLSETKKSFPYPSTTGPRYQQAGVIMNSEFTLRFPQQEYHLNCWSISGMESTVTVRTSDGPSYAFDMGQATRPSVSADYVMITHGHTDHCGAIHKHVAQRDLLSKRPATYFCPPDIEKSLKAICRQYAIMGEYNKPTMENPTILPISLGSRTALSNKRTLVPFITYHRVPSQGYMIYSKEHVLKPEYAHVNPRQAHEMTRQGVEVREWKEIPEIAYTGDTTFEAFTDTVNADVLNARILITEATYICDKQSPSKAKERGHCHLMDFAKNADLFQNVGALVLVHLSDRYNRRHADQWINRSLPMALKKKTWVPTLNKDMEY
ncbi:hypothetical protein RvY_02496 [Ramazzottius varieornatus]|uniref:Metallo-beta-lactamase domain-containing protein n=1 Tax=Ramazzottius varieornatus TaxID=947166 RepID=A0A1D1UNN6_RAMVA|nr:hypothetical protein RvY_02496 [Ramazzottius varieornatus]